MNTRGIIIACILLAVLWFNTGLISDFINRNDDSLKGFVKGERDLPGFVVKNPKNPQKPRGDQGVGDTGPARDAGSGNGKPAVDHKGSSKRPQNDANDAPAQDPGFGARAVGVQRARGL